jgi:hypothetical protein
MKNVFCFGTPCLFLLLAAACVSTNATIDIVPYVYTNNTNTDFEILGEVIYESSRRVGYIELLRAARNQYPDCHYVIDIMVDQRITTTTETTSFFMRQNQSTYTSAAWVMRGTAIKYSKIEPFASLGLSASSSNNDTMSPANSVINNSLESSLTDYAGGTAGPVSSIMGNYTVLSISGSVARQNSSGKYTDVKKGDVLTRNTVIRINSQASLVLKYGDTTLSVMEGQTGRISALKVTDISEAD